jgi:hypothetical protein
MSIRIQSRILGISAIAFVTLVAFAASLLINSPHRMWIQGMIALAGIESMAGFLTLYWAMRRSERLFFSAFGGGMFFRLLALAAAAVLLYKASVPIVYPLLALVMVSMVGQLIQIPFLERKA